MTTDVSKMGMLEARDAMLADGSIYLVIKEKHKGRFKACAKRVDVLERMLKNRTRLKMCWYYIYALYSSIINTMQTVKHDELSYAVDVYMVSWKHISNIHGEPLDGNMFKITFSKNT